MSRRSTCNPGMHRGLHAYNNGSERDMRDWVVPIREASHKFMTERGVRVFSILQSLAATCSRLNLDVGECFLRVLRDPTYNIVREGLSALARPCCPCTTRRPCCPHPARPHHTYSHASRRCPPPRPCCPHPDRMRRPRTAYPQSHPMRPRHNDHSMGWKGQGGPPCSCRWPCRHCSCKIHSDSYRRHTVGNTSSIISHCQYTEV